MTHELKRYSAEGNGFIESVNGANPGVEFTDGSEIIREIALLAPIDLSNRTCTATFRREAKTLGGSWAYVLSYTKTVSDTSGGIDLLSANKDFVPYDQCLKDDGSWKPGIVSEAEFTINTIIFNTYGISVNISQFLYNAILRTNGLI